MIKYVESETEYSLWDNNKDMKIKYPVFDIDVIKNIKKEKLIIMKNYQEELKENLKNNTFKGISQNSDRAKYTMEVVDVINDIVIAKVISSKSIKGSFIYRLNDKVVLEE